MLTLTRFQNCPRCGANNLQAHDAKSFCCPVCDFIYYHATNAAAVAVVVYAGQVIVTRRAFDPFRGRLAFPGGFVDYRETLEDALHRELREELNCHANGLRYLCSAWDRYDYRDVTYFTSVAYFVTQLEDASGLAAADDVADFFWADPLQINPQDFAFQGDQIALCKYLELIKNEEVHV
ncbi:MAG: nucleotide pyrophosphohydrolase [Chloroflexi bacterium HGW-Chloroflexi-10]|nr:MAG: nucleotide pyrophosphohydrolase [Chloroflexi bacterium HGW-Chloroflexi-10]